jgi:hypothetical protein
VSTVGGAALGAALFAQMVGRIGAASAGTVGGAVMLVILLSAASAGGLWNARMEDPVA